MLKNFKLIKEIERSEIITEGMVDKIRSMIASGKKASLKALKPLAKVYHTILKKIPTTKEGMITSQLSKYSKQINNILQNNMSEDVIHRVVEDSMKEAQMGGLIPDPELPKDEIDAHFKANAKRIYKIIENNIEQATRAAKQKVQAKLMDIDGQIDQATSKKKGRIRNFSIGAAGPMVFGLIDNAGMFLGMGAIEESLAQLGFDSMTAAGFGNTFSDALGAAAGGAVAAFLYKTLKVKGEGTITQQFLGVIVGCLIPVGIKIALQLAGISESKEDKLKRIIREEVKKCL